MMDLKIWIKVGIITGIWGLVSSIVSINNIRHTETLWWFSGSLLEKIFLLPAYLTNLIGNPFMPILRGEGVVITPLSAIIYHILMSILIGFVIGSGIGLIIHKFKK